MKVSSPIGELPFEPKRISFKGRKIQIDGEMGSWPAKVVIESADIPSILKLVARPLAIFLVSVALVLISINRFMN